MPVFRVNWCPSCIAYKVVERLFSEYCSIFVLEIHSRTQRETVNTINNEKYKKHVSCSLGGPD